MRGFLRDREPACEVAVERHAVAQQVVDARGRLAGEAERDILVDEAGADRDGVGRMRFGGVAFADGRGDAALRPGAGGAFTERCGRDDGDRPRRQLQRAEQPGKPAADDDDVVDVCCNKVGHVAASR